ncbi:MAG TPA: histidinol-phosphate transaminase [Acidimicrobiales bacterium]|nr:histidinol-phosphate transaminase [Acidimicrobiales bacterium]
MNTPLTIDGNDFRPLWVLPDADALNLLTGGADTSGLRGSVAVVGELHQSNGDFALVLVEVDSLTATELSLLVQGNSPITATRVSPLPASLDAALGCLAPSLARARRLVLDALDEDDAARQFTLEARDRTGGFIECARVEAQRLRPETLVVLSDTEREIPPSWQREENLSDHELAQALAVLADHSTQFRPVIVAAFGNDELDRLHEHVERSAAQGDGNLDLLAGRVLVRSLPPTALPDQVQSDPELARSTTPHAGTPAGRALEKVVAVAGYRRGRAARGAGSNGKLSANESPFGPPPAVRAALRAASENLNRYPEEDPVLVQLAEHLGIDVERLVLTNGSDELCYLLARLLLDDAPDSTGARRQGFTVVGDPCYQIDATASTLAGAPIVRVPLVDGAHDLDAMAQAARNGATLVWLPSPHNPTGVSVALADLMTFLDAVPSDCLVVLDEAYGGFSLQDDSGTALKLSESRPNLLVQRTFSKDWGLAGLRVGYAVGDPVLISAIRRARPPFSVNALAIAAVSAILRCDEWRASIVSRIVEERELLESTLDELGVTFFPSEANFVTCALPFAELRDALASDGLSIRDGADLGLPGWTRITVGWAPQMAALRDVLRHMSNANLPGR